MRYENLVTDPRAEMKALYEGLGMAEFGQALPAIDSYLASVADHRVASYELSPELRDRIMQDCGDSIDRYGYTVPAWSGSKT